MSDIIEGEVLEESPSSTRQPGSVNLHFPLYKVRITYLLIGLNVLLYLPTMVMRNTVYAYGGLIPVLIFQYGEFWRVLTAGFIHGDIMHIAFNMYALHSFGRVTERFFGPGRFSLIYFLSLLGGSVIVTLFNAGESLTIGASGAVLGLLGALIAYFWQYQQQLAGAREQLFNLATTAAINLGIGLLPHVSLWGHLGGTVAGFLIGLILIPVYDYKPPAQLKIMPLGFGKLLISILMVVGWLLLLGVAVLLRG